MSKKLLIISTSPRKNGNSEILSDEFAKGAQGSGHIVEKISLYDKDIKFCKGCFACQSTKKCIVKDDMSKILENMLIADVIVFATPVYFYEMCGQMKTLLDRTNPLFISDYKFRDIYLIATAADKELSSIDGTVNGLMGWVECFDKAKFAGIIRGVSVESRGDIKKFPKLLEETYKLGKEI